MPIFVASPIIREVALSHISFSPPFLSAVPVHSFFLSLWPSCQPHQCFASKNFVLLFSTFSFPLLAMHHFIKRMHRRKRFNTCTWDKSRGRREYSHETSHQ